MTVTYNTAAATARLQAVLTAAVPGQSVDGQTTGTGQMIIGTNALSPSGGPTGVLCTVTLPKPSFSISGKVATLLGVPIAATPSAPGTAALANLQDSTGNVIASGLTVGIAGTDVIVTTTTFSTSVPISVIATSTITHP